MEKLDRTSEPEDGVVKTAEIRRIRLGAALYDLSMRNFVGLAVGDLFRAQGDEVIKRVRELIPAKPSSVEDQSLGRRSS